MTHESKSLVEQLQKVRECVESMLGADPDDDEVRDNCVAALDQIIAGMGWREIKSAPRDGTLFLGAWRFQGRWVFRLAKWNNYHKSFNQFPAHHTGPFELWQSLPPPPSQTTDKEQGE